MIGSKRGKSISPCWSSIWYSKSAMSQNFCGFVSAPIKWFRHFTITACHSVDRTTWLLVVYTEPSPRTFLVYKCLNIVQMSFVLQHCVPPTFIFFLSLQKKKTFQCSKNKQKNKLLIGPVTSPWGTPSRGSGTTGCDRIQARIQGHQLKRSL